MRHEQDVELRLFRFDLIADLVHVLEEGDIFLDEGCLGVWLDGLELRHNSLGGISTPVQKNTLIRWIGWSSNILLRFEVLKAPTFLRSTDEA